MTTLVSGGCSFTYGFELRDINNVWTKLLADRHGLAFAQTAHMGIGNLQIAQRCMEAVTDDSIVVVMWTFPVRYDYLLSIETWESNHPWFTLTPMHTDLKNAVKNGFHPDHVKRVKGFGIESWAKEHYKFVGDMNEAHNTLWQILQLQNFLKVNDIPYMFTSAHNWLLEEHYDIYNWPQTKNLVNNIDWSNWFWFPGEKKEHGFHHWSVAEGFEIGPGKHPLDEAHTAAVDLMEDKFNEIFKEYL